jgi:hypothetical protein
MQYIRVCNLCGSPMSVTILTGLPIIVHSYRHENLNECNFHIAAMLLRYIPPKYIFTKNVHIIYKSVNIYIFSTLVVLVLLQP